MDLIELAKTEIINRHHFFVEWFTGRAPETAMLVAARAFAPDMRMIEPGGSMIGTDEITSMIAGARGQRPPDFEIWVDMIEARLIGEDTALVIYDEHQKVDGAKTARRSSAVFSADASAPEGVVWRQLQETWITKD